MGVSSDDCKMTSMVCCFFQVYSEYRASLAFDLVSSRQKNVSVAVESLASCIIQHLCFWLSKLFTYLANFLLPLQGTCPR